MAKATILFVDDEPELLDHMSARLKDEGYEVLTASSPSIALDLLPKQQVDIVFTDLLMPQMNGVELCRKVKMISSDTEVVLISGYADKLQTSKGEFVHAGGRDMYLRKPFSMDELLNATEKILRDKAQGKTP